METVRRHFHGQDDLVIVCINDESLGDDLRWERSRGGELFPHLYGILATELIDLPRGPDGEHEFPPGAWHGHEIPLI